MTVPELNEKLMGLTWAVKRVRAELAEDPPPGLAGEMSVAHEVILLTVETVGLLKELGK